MNQFKRNSTTIAIYHSLMRLLENDNFDAITVNDICTEAIISRTTFYSYFEDKYQLILFFFEEERRSLGLIRGIDITNNLKKFLFRIKDKKSIYKNLLVSHANAELRSMITSNFEETIKLSLHESYSKEKKEILSIFYSGGVTFTIMEWISSDCSYDIDLLSETISEPIPR